MYEKPNAHTHIYVHICILTNMYIHVYKNIRLAQYTLNSLHEMSKSASLYMHTHKNVYACIDHITYIHINETPLNLSYLLIF